MGSPDQPRDARGRFARTEGRTKQEVQNDDYFKAKEEELHLGELADRAYERLNAHLAKINKPHTDMEVLRFEMKEEKLQRAADAARDRWAAAKTKLRMMPRPRKKRRR